MKLAPWSPARKRTLWLDSATGTAMDDDGRAGRVGQSGPPSLADVLDVAGRLNAARVILTGPAPARAWFLGGAEGWTHGAHYLDVDVPVGRYERAGVRVEVRTAAEWFGAGDYGPGTARAAESALATVYGAHVRGGSLFASPGATGLDAWLRSLPRTAGSDGAPEAPEQLPDDLAQLVRSTSPQHRIERFRPPAGAETMPALWYLDGRWMYAALCKELGTGPARMMTGAQSDVLWTSKGGRYARARYRVSFAAPAGWDGPGLLMAKAGEGRHDGWHAPTSGATWADAAEVELAERMGWAITLHEGIAFGKGRPLDTWADRLVRARASVSDHELGEQVAGMVRAGVRAILLHAIGGWHSSGRSETTVTASTMQPPAGEGWGAPEPLGSGAFLWRRRHELSGRAAAMVHPEWSSQVWGRAHARVLDGPTSTPGLRSGALYLRPGTLVGIYGDAVMTTERPAWADLDDGANGRLRVKGHACGPLPWPVRASERDELARQADAAGPICPRSCP